MRSMGRRMMVTYSGSKVHFHPTGCSPLTPFTSFGFAKTSALPARANSRPAGVNSGMEGRIQAPRDGFRGGFGGEFRAGGADSGPMGRNQGADCGFEGGYGRDQEMEI
eukprot:1190349-Prorocentrum_minimum.AAC.5